MTSIRKHFLCWKKALDRSTKMTNIPDHNLLTWEEFKARKRKQVVELMKENGITYEQADDAFLDMMMGENDNANA